MTSPSVTTWIGLLRSGDADAAESLWRRYYAELVEQARKQLQQRFRRGGEEEDIAVSAFAQFCKAIQNGRFPRVTDRHDLWKLLLTLTIRQAQKHLEYETRQKRDIQQTLLATDLFALSQEDLDRLAGEQPDPALVAEIGEQFRYRLSHLPGEDLRKVARDLLEGYTAVEIAQRHQCSLRTVERRFQRIRQFWIQTPSSE